MKCCFDEYLVGYYSFIIYLKIGCVIYFMINIREIIFSILLILFGFILQSFGNFIYLIVIVNLYGYCYLLMK